MYLRFIVDDGVDGVPEVLAGHEVQVEDHCSSFCLHVVHVVRLVGKHGDAHHGNAVVDGLIEAVGATVGDEGSRLWMTC